MKKILIVSILLLLFADISCFGQEISLSDTVKIALPDGAEKLSRDSYANYESLKYGYSKLALTSVPKPNARLDNKHFFRVNDILVRLTRGVRSADRRSGYLSALKKSLDDLNKMGGENNYTSEIKSINGNLVLITYYEIENVAYYDFYSHDASETYILNGSLQFKSSEKAIAKTILDNLVASIRFKK